VASNRFGLAAADSAMAVATAAELVRESVSLAVTSAVEIAAAAKLKARSSIADVVDTTAETLLPMSMRPKL
jgi:hypothetical protein